MISKKRKEQLMETIYNLEDMINIQIKDNKKEKLFIIDKLKERAETE